MPAPPDMLQDVPLFRELDAEERAVLAAQAEELSWAAEARIFSRGDAGDSFYVVSHGRVEISVDSTTGERRVLGTAGPGEFFGELSLLDGGARSADATAVEETHGVEIDRDDLTELFRVHPGAAMDVLSVTGKRLRETNRALLSSAGISPNQQVEERSTPVQRAADALAAFSGSIAFLVLHCLIFALWVGWNLGAIGFLRPFDPFPFGLLTLVTSLEAIFLSCFVLISQERQASKDRIRSEVEYAANIKAGLEVTQLHGKLDRLYEQTMSKLAALEQRAHLRP
jgi:CRP/FNR family transcriptional regulator, cyclic AMP receptor protein